MPSCSDVTAIPLEERTLEGLHESLVSVVTALEGVDSDSPILDIGCGTGAWLNRLYSHGYRHLIGIDRDVQHFGAPEGIHFMPTDLEEDLSHLVLPAKTFKLITIIEVIEHLSNPGQLVRYSNSLLVNGGWLLITSPNIYSLRSRLRFLFSGHLPAFEKVLPRIPIEIDHLHPVVVEAYKRKIFEPLDLRLERIWTFPEKG